MAKKCSPAELPNEPELFEVHYLVLPDYKPVPSDEETLKTALQMSLSDYIDKNP